MIKLDKDNKYTTFSTKLTFEDYGEAREAYTDTQSIYDKMINADKVRFTNYVTETVKLTDEEQTRLDDLNSCIEGEANLNGVEEYSTFVKDGYIKSDTTNLLSKLIEKYQDSSNAYLMDKLRTKVKELKDEKEVGGMEYNGHIVQTDTESQSKITGIFCTLQTGVMDSINFKFANDEHAVLTVDEFNIMSLLVSAHIQSVYNTEVMVDSYLSGLSNAALEGYLNKSSDGESTTVEATKENDLTMLFDEYYNNIMSAYASEITAGATGESVEDTSTTEETENTTEEEPDEDTTKEEEQVEEDTTSTEDEQPSVEESTSDEESSDTTTEEPIVEEEVTTDTIEDESSAEESVEDTTSTDEDTTAEEPVVEDTPAEESTEEESTSTEEATTEEVVEEEVVEEQPADTTEDAETTEDTAESTTSEEQ